MLQLTPDGLAALAAGFEPAERARAELRAAAAAGAARPADRFRGTTQQTHGRAVFVGR